MYLHNITNMKNMSEHTGYAYICNTTPFHYYSIEQNAIRYKLSLFHWIMIQLWQKIQLHKEYYLLPMMDSLCCVCMEQN